MNKNPFGLLVKNALTNQVKNDIVDHVEKQNKKVNINPIKKVINSAILDNSKHIFTGNFSKKFNEKLAEQFNNNDDLHTFIADTIVKELNSFTKKKSGPSPPPPPFVTKILQKIRNDEDFKQTILTILDKADDYRSSLINKLDNELQKVINGIKTKYIGNYREPIDLADSQFAVVNFGNKSNKIRNPSTGRYVKRNGKIGKNLVRSNTSKKTHKTKQDTVNKRSRYPKRRHSARIKKL